ncbi:hypothetical protein HanLR1_Chr09g0306031 [Helianthus annuus]|nr:hypothetical protein HanHA89_Chr09g0326531 [Helianthus annuus]KAJ0706354.1 hypothetical protein HanLR1_Chr09g0306031 [Helianthus annuus]
MVLFSGQNRVRDASGLLRILVRVFGSATVQIRVEGGSLQDSGLVRVLIFGLVLDLGQRRSL